MSDLSPRLSSALADRYRIERELGRSTRSVATIAGLLLAAAVSLMSIADGEELASTALMPRDLLIQDVRELSDLLESAHPDPYINGGGKVAYHRRLQDLIRSIPDTGLTRQDFHALLEPFVARLGDGHTTLQSDQSTRDYGNPGGIPVLFEVIDENLYVGAVTRDDDLPLIGAILESVEGVEFEELMRRESRRQGHDSRLHTLHGLSKDGPLYFGESLRRLIPEWEGGGEISVGLRHASGDRRELTLRPAENVTYPLLQRPSRIQLPEANRSFAYHFLEEDRNIAFLRIDDMTSYRESFEYSRAVGSAGYESWARNVYRRANGEDAPAELDDVIAGIPSATETFASLSREMKVAGSQTLIVDLRRNFGGLDLMVPMFLYFMIGFDETMTVMQETSSIQKLSPLFAGSTASGVDLESIRYSDRVPLTLGDYDFSQDPMFMSRADLSESLRASHLRMFGQMPTFDAVFSARDDEASHLPEQIYVLCSNRTQSSGFDLLTNLRRLGASVIGVPPSQAGNHFGNTRRFALTHSGLTGYVSTKYFVAYPGQPATGYTLPMDHLLDYGKLAAFGFDRNAALLLALDVIGTLPGEQ